MEVEGDKSTAEYIETLWAFDFLLKQGDVSQTFSTEFPTVAIHNCHHIVLTNQPRYS